MRLHLLLPEVDPKTIPVPFKCAYTDCTSQQVRLHQPVSKALRDMVHQQVEVHRYRCLKYGRNFRVYPLGVTHAQRSDRVKGLEGCCICLQRGYSWTIRISTLFNLVV